MRRAMTSTRSHTRKVVYSRNIECRHVTCGSRSDSGVPVHSRSRVRKRHVEGHRPGVIRVMQQVDRDDLHRFTRVERQRPAARHVIHIRERRHIHRRVPHRRGPAGVVVTRHTYRNRPGHLRERVRRHRKGDHHVRVDDVQRRVRRRRQGCAPGRIRQLHCQVNRSDRQVIIEDWHRKSRVRLPVVERDRPARRRVIDARLAVPGTVL